MRTIGGAFGAQIAAAIVAGHVVAGSGYSTESGFTTAFVVGAVAVTLAVGAATLIPGPPRATRRRRRRRAAARAA